MRSKAKEQAQAKCHFYIKASLEFSKFYEDDKKLWTAPSASDTWPSLMLLFVLPFCFPWVWTQPVALILKPRLLVHWHLAKVKVGEVLFFFFTPKHMISSIHCTHTTLNSSYLFFFNCCNLLNWPNFHFLQKIKHLNPGCYNCSYHIEPLGTAYMVQYSLVNFGNFSFVDNNGMRISTPGLRIQSLCTENNGRCHLCQFSNIT